MRSRFEEAWELKKHLPLDVEGMAGYAKVVSVQLEELVYQADGLNSPSPPINVFHSEKPAIRIALDRWLSEVKTGAFPARASGLRYALFVEDLGALAFRDVVFCFEDERETHELNVLVTGDPFEHDGRWWTPQDWRRMYGIDEFDGELRTWLRCREIPPRDRLK
jgi:hypothetical protein